MRPQRAHGFILGLLLLLAAIELFILPVLKVITGHAILPWLQR